MKRYRVRQHCADVRQWYTPSVVVTVPDGADTQAIIAAAKFDGSHWQLELVLRLGYLPRVTYSIVELPTGERMTRPLQLLRRGVPA